MKTTMKIGLVLLACLMLMAGCASAKTTYATHADAVTAFSTAIKIGDYKTMSTVWSGNEASDLKPFWDAVTGSCETEYIGGEDTSIQYYKIAFTLQTKPADSKSGLSEGQSIVWYASLEKVEESWAITSLSTTPIYAEFLPQN